MLNVLHRIVSHTMLIALLVSVGLTALTQNTSEHERLLPPANYLACDLPDQANLDTDLDNHTIEDVIGARQSPTRNDLSHYVSCTFIHPFSYAYQRGPPTYYI